ncbi:MAG TPA: ABC transporter substrate-binding protein [Methylomirabilota bacterium]|jgi:branched-chain amino acid transport system substrate-binding protein|nr:ABC transporter substrate-binding protein [Methylomirabilota bacterium]
MAKRARTDSGRREFLKTAATAGAIAGFPGLVRAQAREVKVGYILPVTGPLAFEAALALNGILLAVDEINAAGGIKSLGGARITLLAGDTQNKVELGNSEAARLIDQGIAALIGPFSSLVAYSVRQVTEKNKTPFLLLAAVADNLCEGGLRYIFRMQPNGKGMATLTVNHMVEMAKAANTPVKRVAMMHEDGNFGTTMGNHVEAFAKTAGYELVQRVPYNLKSPDFTTELAKVKATRPDLLVISGYYGDSKLIAETAAKLKIGVSALVGLANAAYSNPKFIADNRELTEDLFDGNYWHNPTSVRAKAVFAAYQKRFNSPMANHGVQGYQVTYVLKDALERAASTDRDKVRDALARTNLADHILTQDAIKFDDTGENVNASPALIQVQGGRPVVVGPSRYAEAKPVFPVPKWKA